MAQTVDEYQAYTETTEIYSKAAYAFTTTTPVDIQRDWLAWAYCTGKLNGEAGEIAELVFKALRDGEQAGYMDPERLAKIKKELGDVLWYVARLSALGGWNLSSVLEDNMKKLQSRKDRGVLTGSGDER
jgi:NTP pyrophosphatase (non-canonical NTP hydrolase)